jgi:hypothetical protein
MWKLAEDQLDVAEFLATRADRRRPRQAALRRAVSTAYYALFQALSEMCADALVGWTQPWQAFTPIFRSVEHGRTLTVLNERGPNRTHPLGIEVETIGAAFRELQAAREWADYNPEPHPDPRRTAEGAIFSRTEAIALVAAARAAVSGLYSLDAATRLSLATLLVTRSRKEARR